MKIPNIFERKQAQRESSGGLYPHIVNIHGKNTPQYSDAKYRIIAKEGYAENWIIFRCLQEITQAAIQLKWNVCKKDKDGKKVPIPNHPVQVLLDKPNPLYSQAEFIRRAIVFYYLGGDAPIVRMAVRGGKLVKEIYTYRPDKMSIGLTGKVDMPYTDIRYEGQNPKNFKPEDFTLWKSFNPLDEYDGLGRGMSPLKPILKNGDLLAAMLDWNVSLMQNGGQVSGVISVGEFPNNGARERAQADLNSKYSGTPNVGKWMLVEGDRTSVLQTGTNPKDMDWIKGKESTMRDICIGMGIDPIIIGFNEQSSYNNKSEAEKGLYTKSVIPLMQGLAGQLTPFLGLEDGEFIDIDYSEIPVLQEDIGKINEKLNNNYMEINEKRKARGLENVEGGDIVAPEGSFAIIKGKVYLPANLIPVDDEISSQETLDNSQKQNKSFQY